MIYTLSENLRYITRDEINLKVKEQDLENKNSIV